MPGYISEISYDGNRFADFVEIVLPGGTDPTGYTITFYDSSGGIVVSPIALNMPSTTEFGSDIYVVDANSTAMPDLRAGYSFALADGSGTVLQFSTFGGTSTVSPTTGAAAGLTSTNIGSAGTGKSLETTDGGATYALQAAPNPGTIPAPPPCYAPGTLIDTPNGPRPVEDLQVGDLVNTVDHGPQAIRWVRSGEHPLEEVDVDAKPVLITAGALGKGLPSQNLIVSPQHRMFVGGGGQLEGCFKTESFAPAKSLTALQGIRHMKGKQSITWIHFACDQHEVIMANGCLSESLLLGPMVLNGLTSHERQELTAIYGDAPTPAAALNGPAARECLKVGEVRRQLAKYEKENRRRTAKEIKKWDVDLAMEQWEADRLDVAMADGQKPNLRIAC